MLPRENRLVSGKDFDLVHKTGQFFSSGAVFLNVRGNGLKKARIGFSIGIKFSPKAVLRNKAKRMLREIAQGEVMHIKKGLDMVVMLKKEKSFPQYADLKKDLTNILQKGNLFIKQ